MNEFFTYLFLGIIIIFWLILIFSKKITAFTFLILSLIIYYERFSTINIDFVIKVLMLITVIICLFIYGFDKRFIKLWSIILLFFIIILFNSKFSTYYTFYDMISSFLSLMIGLLCYSVNWPGSYQLKPLKFLSLMPIISIILGLIFLPTGLVPLFSRYDGSGLGGISLATNLSFFCVVGIMSSTALFKETKEKKYRILSYVNFFIVLMTLTRGGIIACTILLAPDFYNWLKESSKNQSKFIFSIISFIPIATIIGWITPKIMERTFSDGALNTSGRLDAWNYIISLIQNRWIGNGLGNLKTLVNDPVLKQGFTAAHNEYVRIYFETGIIGFTIHLVIFCFIFSIARKKVYLELKTLVVTSMLCFMIYSFTDNTITNFRFWVPYLFVLSLISRKFENYTS